MALGNKNVTGWIKRKPEVGARSLRRSAGHRGPLIQSSPKKKDSWWKIVVDFFDELFDGD